MPLCVFSCLFSKDLLNINLLEFFCSYEFFVICCLYQLKTMFWKPLFWSDSYFVATVSENSLSIVREYIQNQ